MSKNIVTKKINIDGMTCSACELKIEKNIKQITGVIHVDASYSSGIVQVTYDENETNENAIIEKIIKLGYSTSLGKATSKNHYISLFSKLVVAGILIFILYNVLNMLGVLDILNKFPIAKEGMSLATIFIIGLLTSIHCIGMCGGINLSQCARINEGANNIVEKIRPSILYNTGRLFSYTLIGGIVGAIGSVISFTGMFKGIVAIVAGIFMIIMGLNMLNLFPFLKKLNISMPKFFQNTFSSESNSPLYVGILNGLMPCGPLQAMQLYALSTGSPVKGALSMFLFCLGTIPLMFGFGAVSTFLSNKFTTKMMAVSSILVIILGFGMINTGFALSAVPVKLDSKEATINKSNNDVKEVSEKVFEPIMEDGKQVVTINVMPRFYEPIKVKKDIPVKWVVNAKSQNLNGCNNEIIVPTFGLSKPLEAGENIIEFTPTEAGVIPYSCWMGMIRSNITVIE